MEDGSGQHIEDALQDEGSADGEQDGRHLVLDKGPEAEAEEAEQDGRGQQAGDTAPTWSVTWEVTPPRAAFQGSATASHDDQRQRGEEDGPQTATVMTLASSTRLRTGTRTSDVVMVLWRYSLVTQSTPMIGARTSIPK